MLEKLKTIFGSVTSVISQKKLNKKELDKVLSDFEIELIECDVAQPVAEIIIEKVKDSTIGQKIERSENIEEYLKKIIKETLKDILNGTNRIDIIKMIKDKTKSEEPFKIVFLGINGTGKTTTVSKMAKLLKDNGFSVVLACADTHRAGAIEQLTEHANRLSIKTVSQSYGSDPGAVARDAVLYAQSHRIDAVLIDTAGRMQTSKNLMDEVSKVIRVVKPDLKIFVCDALAGNDALSQAEVFLKYTDFDATILTKIDADAKGGAALSVANVSGKPIIFLGTGQEYNDLIPFNTDNYVSLLFN